jgi:hypothetical protein
MKSVTKNLNFEESKKNHLNTINSSNIRKNNLDIISESGQNNIVRNNSAITKQKTEYKFPNKRFMTKEQKTKTKTIFMKKKLKNSDGNDKTLFKQNENIIKTKGVLISNGNKKKDNKENKDNKEDNKVIDNNNIKDKNEDIKEEQKSKSSKNTYTVKPTIKLTNKTRFFEKLKDNFNVYFDGYYEYYMKNVIDTIIKDFDENEAKVTSQVCEFGVNYLNQIKDMEYLLDNKDTEESYRKELGNIIKQLTEERQSIVDKIISENEAKIKKIGNKYSVNNSILKEKFKLDTTKLINSFIFK